MLEQGTKITVTEKNFKAHDADICTLKAGDILTIEDIIKKDKSPEQKPKVLRAVSSSGYSYIIKNEDSNVAKLLNGPKYLESPYVTLFFGILTECSTNYNVYECLDTSLDKHLKNRTALLTDEEKDIVFLSSLRGARAFAHYDLFYCDLKPANIAVSLTNGKITAAKLCDFDAIYGRNWATFSRCTSPWGSPRAFENITNTTDIVLYPLGMLLFFLYSGENLWSFIEDNHSSNNFESTYNTLADEAYAADERPSNEKNRISSLWHESDEVIRKLHSTYSPCPNWFSDRIKNKLSIYFHHNSKLTDELTQIICAATVYGNNGTAKASLDKLEENYCKFMRMRGTDNSLSERLVVIELRRNDIRFEVQFFYIADGESINVPVCSFERLAERVIRGRLFLSALNNKVYYCINEENTESSLTPLSGKECIVNIDNIDLYIRLIS